jgi:hypothetical protein
MGARQVKQNSWTWGPPASEKGHVVFLRRALRKRVMEEGLDRVRLFSTIRARRVVPLAMRMTRKWEYTGPADPDRVSLKELPDDEVWSWVELVLKVGNQRTIGGPDAFDKGHPPNLMSFFPSPSSCQFSCAQLAPNFLLNFLGTRSSSIPPSFA